VAGVLASVAVAAVPVVVLVAVDCSRSGLTPRVVAGSQVAVQ
jgi:hypothetical protein